ncbi:uncharacterized protein BO80DRAFT_120255 [Aspergillus ibericus CBS 121593]|uniref:Uncharacterized protein n=1 Tax=Aspergillus ibericus CBS 121593 TaxID=1448316 RepID=A0A395GWA3_9EURO|nr:hypothetical protein BO80DRAFT_120255 [Aspergillus ibericus CBS 121593]RAK99639.1 hypothetical protein BO80DRAFT_120255 [Aspergillus ibericus CBS 121593]
MASRNRGLSLPDALNNLAKSSSKIQRRGGLKPHEEKRVREGFTVLLTALDEHRMYHAFLSKIKDLCEHRGYAMVVLCIVGLGKHAIKILKDQVQLDLPFEIVKRKEDLWNSTLDYIGRKYVDDLSLVHVERATDTFQSKNLKISTNLSVGSGSHSQTLVIAPHPPSGPRHGSISLDLRVRDLVNFFQENQELDKIVQMECPLSGDPLPSISISLD